MAGYLYVGESDGGRIVRTGTDALTQVTTASTESVLLVLETQDAEPMGPSGDCVFRSIVVPITYSNGYAVTITPYVDGVALSPQSFTGSGSGKESLTAWVKSRGARCRVKIAQTTRTGDLTVENAVVWYVAMRGFP